MTAAATVALSAAAGLGVGAAAVVAARPARGGAAETPERARGRRARVEDSVEDSVAEDSGVVAGKKKRGGGGSEAAAEARASLKRTAARRQRRDVLAREGSARTTTNLA